MPPYRAPGILGLFRAKAKLAHVAGLTVPTSILKKENLEFRRFAMLVVVKIKDLCKGVQRGPIGTTFNTPCCRSRLRSLITAIRMRNPFVSHNEVRMWS